MLEIWAFPIGIALAVLQYFLLTAMTKGITVGKMRPAMAALMIIAKLALLFFTLFGLAAISSVHMLWAAGGMVAVAFAIMIRGFIKLKAQKGR
ncbi:MAG: hypothetical protein Q8O09_05365 [Bacillota bacterium]|nr:hypothetical protein [Bacillota bacterium]